MFQIRIHGRGGQGVVTAAELLSVAAFLEGQHAQAFPSFGSERTGAPVVAFCRIDEKEIRLREPILEPDALIVQDPTLLPRGRRVPGLSRTATCSSTAIAHSPSSASPTSSRLRAPGHACMVPATELALKHVGRPLPNAALLGAFAALTGIVHLDRSPRAIRAAFPGKVGEANVAAATAAIDAVAAMPALPEGAPHAEADRRIARDRRGDRAVPARGRSAPIRSRRRPTSSRASARWCGRARSRTASSSTSSRSSPRCPSRSAPRRPARAPTRRRRARACCSWPRRSTTPRASACRS